jgi:hypothetical protein
MEHEMLQLTLENQVTVFWFVTSDKYLKQIYSFDLSNNYFGVVVRVFMFRTKKCIFLCLPKCEALDLSHA